MKSNILIAFLSVMILQVSAVAETNYCNFTFGKPEKKLKNGVEVPSLEGKGQIVVVNDNGKVTALMVTDKGKDKVEVLIPDERGNVKKASTKKISSFLTVLDASELKSANQVIINVIKNHDIDVTKPPSVKTYTLVKPSTAGMNEKGAKIVAEQTNKCTFFLQTFFPPLDQLTLSGANDEQE